MKKIITAIFVSALLISVAGKAQTSQPAFKKHSVQMQQMLKDSLHLTDVQIDSVMAIREQTTGTVMSIKNDSSLTSTQRQQQIKEARIQMKTRLNSVLSKEQIKELEEMQHNMHRNKQENTSNI